MVKFFSYRACLPNWTGLDMLAEVARVETEKEKWIEQDSFRRSKHERVLEEKALKKPMTETVLVVPEKERFKEENLENGRKKGLKRSYDDDEWGLEFEKKKKNGKTNGFKESPKRPKKNIAKGPLYPPADLPKEFMDHINAMGGSNVMMLMEKSLFSSDLNKNLNRLSMPLRQIRAEFLTPAEKEHLRRKNPLQVLLIEPNLDESNIVLKQWDMPKNSGPTSSTYNLITTWYDVAVNNNDLKKDDVVQIWSFRHGNELCLAIVLVGRAKAGDKKGKGSENGATESLQDGSWDGASTSQGVRESTRFSSQ